MREEIKFYKVLPWAVATFIIIAGIFTTSFFNLNWINIYSLAPWDKAQGVETLRAINEFDEGIHDMAAYWESRIAALTGLVVLFVIGPSLWVYSEIQNQSKENSSRDDELKKGMVWYVGVMIVIAGLLYAVPVTAVKAYHFQNIWESAAKNRNIDELRSGLTRLAFDAAEQYYLSYETGTKRGFYTIQSGKPISAPDLDNYPQLERSENAYVLAPIESDSLLIMYGVGYHRGPDPDFENANGDQGKLQLAVEVNPKTGIYNFVNENINTR